MKRPFKREYRCTEGVFRRNKNLTLDKAGNRSITTSAHCLPLGHPLPFQRTISSRPSFPRLPFVSMTLKVRCVGLPAVLAPPWGQVRCVGLPAVHQHRREQVQCACFLAINRYYLGSTRFTNANYCTTKPGRVIYSALSLIS